MEKNTDALSTTANAGCASRYLGSKTPSFPSDKMLTKLETSGCMGTRGPEASGMSTSRVNSYMPDNVSARLSYNPNQVSANERKGAMKALVDSLGQIAATVTGRENEGV